MIEDQIAMLINKYVGWQYDQGGQIELCGFSEAAQSILEAGKGDQGAIENICEQVRDGILLPSEAARAISERLYRLPHRPEKLKNNQ